MKKQVENIVRHSEVSEKAIEAYLVKRCKATLIDWFAYHTVTLYGLN